MHDAEDYKKNNIFQNSKNENARIFLDEELKEFFEANGYVSIKNLIPHNLLNNLQDDLIFVFKEFGLKKFPYDSGIIALDKKNKEQLHQLHIATSKLTSFSALTKIFTDAIKKIGDADKPVIEIASGYLLGIPKDNRLIYDFHQESNYMKGFNDIFNIHYPIFRTSDQSNGTMSILPRTHKLGTLLFTKDRSSSDSYTNLIPTNINILKKEYEEISCVLELGDCVIFHKDLIHKSNFNASDLCRSVGISRLTQSLNGDWVYRKPRDL